MRYAKLTDGALHYAPNPISIDGRDVFTTDPTPYGYKPVMESDPPRAEGYTPIFDGWEETETAIVQKWHLEPMPEPIAADNIPRGTYFSADEGLYLATASIAAGETITPGVNCTRVTLPDALNTMTGE